MTYPLMDDPDHNDKGKYSLYILCLLLILLELSFPPNLFAEEQTIIFRSPLSTNWKSNILKNKFPEPSGIVYHPNRKTLFTVSDNGYMAEISLKGEIIRKEFILDGDLEGITTNPETGLLYIAIEGDEKILEITPNFISLKIFKIDRYYQDKLIFPKGGNGIESITFVPNNKHTEGGTFFVANQGEGIKGKEKSYIAEIELPLQSNSGSEGKIKRVFLCNIRDIAGMQYIRKDKKIAIISDLQNIYAEITLKGKIIKELSLPGYDQEGITIDDLGQIYLAIDGDDDEYSAIMKIIIK